MTQSPCAGNARQGKFTFLVVILALFGLAQSRESAQATISKATPVTAATEDMFIAKLCAGLSSLMNLIQELPQEKADFRDKITTSVEGLNYAKSKDKISLFIHNDPTVSGEVDVVEGNLCFALNKKVWADLGAPITLTPEEKKGYAGCSSLAALSVLAEETFHGGGRGPGKAVSLHAAPSSFASSPTGTDQEKNRSMAVTNLWRSYDEVSAHLVALCVIWEGTGEGMMVPGDDQLPRLKEVTRTLIGAMNYDSSLFDTGYGALTGPFAADFFGEFSDAQNADLAATKKDKDEKVKKFDSKAAVLKILLGL